MPAGSKVADSEQQYQYSYPFVTPSGHEFTFYDTPDNQRVLLKHASGSSIEFKADGTVYIKSVGDLHTHAGVISASGDQKKGSDKSTVRIDSDYAIEVAGKLLIKCQQLDLEIGGSGRIKAGTDMLVSANTIVQKATEQISLEGTKSVYIDTKELIDRTVSRRSETGTKETGEGKGGLNVMNVSGNTVIQNDDTNGGITIASKGYLNLVCGQERVDITGKYTDTPSEFAQGTFTNLVFAPTSLSIFPPSGIPGSYYEYIETNKDVIIEMEEFRDVGLGVSRSTGLDEIVDVGGLYILSATKIFLN